MAGDFGGGAARPSFRTEFYGDRRVLITGAAGSVGSALSLQLANLGCAHLGMLDQFDHGLLNVVERVAAASPHLPISEALCDVRDARRLETWMRRIEPDVVIHAAALKHVHLGERHPVECVRTNLLGVRNALVAAANCGASHFLLISSDKAAAPTCVMGATKRLAELLLRGFQLERPSRMNLRSVRFGNILGSQGSVLPRLEAQIERGGPIEITHPEMERYFVSPEEAVDFILQIIAYPDQDEGAGVYVREMGEPISILRMAEELVSDSGKRIEIKEIGLRPGEKLKEQLFDQHEVAALTDLPGVYRISQTSADAHISTVDVSRLETTMKTVDETAVAQKLFAALDAALSLHAGERLQRRA